MRSPVEAISQETIELAKQAFQNAVLQKSITVSGTNLVGYELEAPSKKLYPVLSPLRNRIARVKATVGSTQAHWKQITAINANNVKAAVAFGTRNATTISYTEVDRAATYKSIGLDDAVEDEAVWLGRGFEDVRAFSALATLQALMIEEEKLILGGLSTDLTLGQGPTPTVTKDTNGGGSWGGTVRVWVKCVPLSLYGYLIFTSHNDMTQALTDYGSLSSVGNVDNVAATDSVYASVTPVNGAFAYAWFVGTGAAAGAEPADTAKYLMKVTTVPAAVLTSSDNTHWAASNVTADTSGDANAFDGLFPQIINVKQSLTTIGSFASGALKRATSASAGFYATNALVYDMKTANGLGTTLTSDNAGGIVELDIVLKALWDYARIGPTLILLNSQEALTITKKIGAGSGLGYRVHLQDGAKDVTGGIFVSGYLNKFSSSLTPGNPDVVPFMIHPFLPPGTIIVISERLPYPSNNVTNVLEVRTQQEYTDFEWARTQRKYEHGVYANESFLHYFPAGCAVIRGIEAA